MWARSISDRWLVLVDFDKNLISISKTHNSHIGTPLCTYINSKLKLILCTLLLYEAMYCCDQCSCMICNTHAVILSKAKQKHSKESSHNDSESDGMFMCMYKILTVLYMNTECVW